MQVCARERRAPTAGADASWSRAQPTASTGSGIAERHSARAAKWATGLPRAAGPWSARSRATRGLFHFSPRPEGAYWRSPPLRATCIYVQPGPSVRPARAGPPGAQRRRRLWAWRVQVGHGRRCSAGDLQPECDSVLGACSEGERRPRTVTGLAVAAPASTVPVSPAGPQLALTWGFLLPGPRRTCPRGFPFSRRLGRLRPRPWSSPPLEPSGAFAQGLLVISTAPPGGLGMQARRPSRMVGRGECGRYSSDRAREGYCRALRPTPSGLGQCSESKPPELGPESGPRWTRCDNRGWLLGQQE
jgi:hypothetical protein